MMTQLPTSAAARCPSAGAPRRDFLKAGAAAGAVAGGGLGAFYFGYEKALGSPVRVGVIGTGDEGSVLIGRMNPNFIEVKSICRHPPLQPSIAPSTAIRAGRVRPGLMSVYGWKSEAEAKRHVKVYERRTRSCSHNAQQDGIEAMIIALPLHLHAPVAIAAMQAGPARHHRKAHGP